MSMPSHIRSRPVPGIKTFMQVLVVRPTRAQCLPAIAIPVGVVGAGVGLFRPAPRVLVAVPPGYAALVNQKGILLSDYRAQVEMDTAKSFSDTTPEVRRRVLREM